MHYPYDVALSFAGEDRAHALALAARLQRAGFSVFFDRFEELWGQDLSERLHDVYGRQCRRAVVFVSEHYLRRPWTNYERRVLVSRALHEDGAFLLPLRVDDTELPGLPGVLAYKDLRHDGIDAIADALCALLAAGTPPPPARLRLAPSDFLYVVVEPGQPGAAGFNLGCLLANDTDAARSLRHLEATVTAPGQRPLQFGWRGFYTLVGRSAMVGMDLALPLPLQPGESLLLGLRFAGPQLDPAWLWQPGTLEVELAGWADVAPRRSEPDVLSRFAAELGTDTAAHLAAWLQLPGTTGAQMLHAAALPLAVTPRPPRA